MFDLFLMLGSMALSAYGQIKQGQQAKRSAQQQAAAAEETARQQEFNATVADAQGRDAIARGEAEAAQLRDQVRGLVGSQRSGYAGQGVVVDSGSAADVQADAKTLGEADVLTIRTNAQRAAWGFNVEAENARRNAAIARKGGVIALKEGQAAQTAGYLGAATTIIGGTSSLLLQRYGWSQRNGATSTRPRAAAATGYQGDALTLGNAA